LDSAGSDPAESLVAKRSTEEFAEDSVDVLEIEAGSEQVAPAGFDFVPLEVHLAEEPFAALAHQHCGEAKRSLAVAQRYAALRLNPRDILPGTDERIVEVETQISPVCLVVAHEFDRFGIALCPGVTP